jgi:hypothetical protein
VKSKATVQQSLVNECVEAMVGDAVAEINGKVEGMNGEKSS